MLIKNYLSVSCNTTTLGTTTELIPSTSESGAGAVTTVLPNVSSRTPATPAPTASPPDSASGNSDHQGNKTTGAGNSSSNKTEKDKSTHPRGEGGGANVLSLSYLTFLLTVVIAYVMKNIEI